MLIKVIFSESDRVGCNIQRWPYDIPRKGDGFELNGQMYKVKHVTWEIAGMDRSIILTLGDV